MGAFPIIYVRGYAGTQGEVEETVEDPFYGFNKGSTHVRIGPQGSARFYAFESPLIRLMADYGYKDVFEGDLQTITRAQGGNHQRTIWIYRYYDTTSKTFEGYKGIRLSIEKAAEGLRQFIDQAMAQTGCSKVNLLAHSMGGLICRSLLQKIYPEAGLKGEDIVDKLFTYGTPHGGIHFDIPGGSVVEWIRDKIGWNNSDDFGKERMYQYLLPESRMDAGGNKIGADDFCQSSLYGYFPPEKVFCIVGTNAKDYDVAMGMSRRTVGPLSDGLVQIESAYVKNSNRAYVHRCHSGRYGMVNSEEAYQNLRRFLFGSLKVSVVLEGLAVPSSRNSDDKYYQAEVGVSIRGMPVLMHERSITNSCPIILQDGTTLLKDNHHLYTFFLIPRLTDDPNVTSARYALRLALYEFKKSGSWLDFSDHMEQTPIWNDHLLVDISCAPGEKLDCSGCYCWNSESQNPTTPLVEDAVSRQVAVPLPRQAQNVVGTSARIVFELAQWE
ncbi:MAG: hypothetical protein PHI31_08740 [Desulfuromonadaceae bacterium]|nr:hypothetical protein [Desulfuromonadaceae bacterium]